MAQMVFFCDMSVFVILHTQLEKAGYKTKQPEARNPFGSVSGTPNFWEKPMLPEAPWASFGWFVAVAFSIFAQSWPRSKWKMENN